MIFVEDGIPTSVRTVGRPWKPRQGYLECSGRDNFLFATRAVGEGDFHIRATLTIHNLARSAASFVMDGRSHFGFEGSEGEIFVGGPVFGGGTESLGKSEGVVPSGEPFVFEVVRRGSELTFLIDGKPVHRVETEQARLGTIALRPWRSTMQVAEFLATGTLEPVGPSRGQPPGFSVPQLDLAEETEGQVIVETIPGQYLGHPTSVLLDDEKTIIITYPLGHGGPAAVLKKSGDGGKTWSERLPVPDNWATATNCPSIHRLLGPDGVERLLMVEGNGEMRQSVSLDEGRTWTPLEPNGLHCVVAPNTIVPIEGGRHLAVYHRKIEGLVSVWQSISADGGVTWQPEREIGECEGAQPCEPAIIRSPDGKQLAVIARENSRKLNSMLMVSDDEGLVPQRTWSPPVELPASLTGDRHMPRYLSDGRLVITFRDMAGRSPTHGDFVAWVGTYDDLVNLREGQYRLRLLDNPGPPGDTGYAGLEVLPDGTLVAITYCPLQAGEQPSVVCVRFRLEGLDERAAALVPQQSDVFVASVYGYHTYRIPALLTTAKGTLLAICEGRRNSPSDHGDIDLVLKRSLDLGATWEPMQVIWGEEGEVTIGNPCPVVDRETGTIWLPFCRDNDRVFVTKSENDGETWATPVEITGAVKPEQWTWYATGPGHGIQLDSARLLIPCDHRDPKKMRSHVFLSDDHGTTWKLGGVLDEKTDECGAVQTGDGRVYINMRSYSGKHRRAVAWSDDGGETWSEAQFDETLVEPVCQASIVRFTGAEGDGKSRVLFSNPADAERRWMTVRTSTDECRTWNQGKLLHGGPAAYSDLGIAPDGTIGCLYERGQNHAYERITFARFSLEWLSDGLDKL